MANWSIEMIDIRRIIQLREGGKSERKTSKILDISRDRVSHYYGLFKEYGLTIAEISELSDEDLAELFVEALVEKSNRLTRLEGMFTDMETELTKKGVTLELLWVEYTVKEEDLKNKAYSYSQFCYHFRQWKVQNNASMRLEHKVGDKLFVDFTGGKLPLYDQKTGEQIQELECFIAILPASQFIYAEACNSQQMADFIGAVENSFHYIGGATDAVVPDNLKSAVTQAHLYEPLLNRNFTYFGEHYDTAIVPARSKKPKDKAHVENAVKIVYRRIFAELRNEKFCTIEAINKRIREKLEELNDRKLTGRDCSRRELFESIEKESLKPLSVHKYEIKNFHSGKVTKFYHIYLSEDKHYYSVPFQYIGKSVKIVYSSRNVEIYHNFKRIAYHLRDRTSRGYTTIKEHLPSNHREYGEWNEEKFLKHGEQIGPITKKYIQEVLTSKQYPEISYKQCLGIISLSSSRKYGKERVEKACERGHMHKVYSYRTLAKILEKNLDKIDDSTDQKELPSHENVRADYQ